MEKNLSKSYFNDFSVLMSLYHAESADNLSECLNSLYKQTCKSKDIVIVFDGPLTNDLYNVVDIWKEKIPIQIVRIKDNVGLGSALNIGIGYCKYELVARMDTDDVAVPTRFERQLELFNSDLELDICGSSIDEFHNTVKTVDSRRVPPLSNGDILSNCVVKNPFNHMTVMYKKSKVLSVGSYQDLPWMEDWYLWLRMLSSGCRGANIKDSLVYARTGLAMMARRSGVKYIKSEWVLTHKKVKLGLVSWPKALMIFIARSVPRVFPTKILLKFYNLSRKNSRVK